MSWTRWMFLALFCSMPQSPQTDSAARPVIVELFTSEGCSSCPPADRLLRELQKTQPVKGVEIIALSEHVDYWNYIGWIDPFSTAAAGARQLDYASVLLRNSQIYTPQMLVDGQAEFNGSNRSTALDAIGRAARLPKAKVNAGLVAKGARELSFEVRVDEIPQISTSQNLDLLLAITENNLSSNVVRGENAGRKLVHDGVVRVLRVIGNSRGTTVFTTRANVKIETPWRREALRAVIFIQERTSRRILGAASVDKLD